MKCSILVAITCALVLTTDALADDFDPPGWYVGIGAGVGADFLTAAIQDLTGGVVDIRPAASVNIRSGYHVLSWLAFEGRTKASTEWIPRSSGRLWRSMT